MTAPEESLARLFLADLPADAAKADLSVAKPLGDRSVVIARLKELLPGLAFDDKGKGTFARGGYTIRFTLEGDLPERVEIEIDKAEAFAPVKRIVDRTGWRPVDPESLGFIDLDASKAIGATVMAGEAQAPEPEVVQAPSLASNPLVKRAVLAAVAVVVLWGAWQYARSRPDTKTPSSVARTQYLSDEALRWAAERARRRMMLARAVAPQFRANPIVLQLFDTWVAQFEYHVGYGMGRYAKIENLSDQGPWARFNVPPMLPPSYMEAERDGYLFEFIGEHCGPMPGNMSAPPDDCDEFIYMARPLDVPGRKGPLPPSFALFSEDQRIHFRPNGDVPSLDDPTVDKPGPGFSAPQPSPGFLSRIGSGIGSVFSAILGPSRPSAASIAASEQSAIQDLRTVAQAEQVIAVMLGGDKYVPPEMLADAKVFSRGRSAPLLPVYFTQPQRMGYEYVFEGQNLTVSPETFSWISEVYGTYVYVARPVDPGPPGRRSFALYPDGLIYSTTEDRVPTWEDTPLGQ